jgi:uncharacterized protein RhaS with RHS repeats
MYHPNLGRFCSRDPIGYDGSQWNVYEYVGSSPIHVLDPSGQRTVRDTRSFGDCLAWNREEYFDELDDAQDRIDSAIARECDDCSEERECRRAAGNNDEPTECLLEYQDCRSSIYARYAPRLLRRAAQNARSRANLCRRLEARGFWNRPVA